MKKNSLFFFLFLILLSCNSKSKVENAVEEIPVNVKVIRFEQAFFDAKASDLSKIKQQYPFFFPAETPDEVWIEKKQNPDWRSLYSEVEKKYKNFEIETTEIEDLFKHIKYYFPKIQVPEVYTVISSMDPANKTIYTKSKLIIALELYLGKNHKFYKDEFPAYLVQNFEQRQMMPDVVDSFSLGVIPPAKENDLLSLMINSGKALYLKDMLLPNFSDAEKIGYTDEQLKFCNENESFMWEYFINNKLLFSTDSKLPGRFINVAPFSKFYLEIDNETPGRVGRWIGWQIVRSYMQNNPKVTLQDLLKTDAKTIFEQSKYKPKKNE